MGFDAWLYLKIMWMQLTVELSHRGYRESRGYREGGGRQKKARLFIWFTLLEWHAEGHINILRCFIILMQRTDTITTIVTVITIARV